MLSGFTRTLQPGMKREDRRAFPVRLLLQGGKQGAAALELVYESDDRNSTGTGAFAHALLSRPDEIGR